MKPFERTLHTEGDGFWSRAQRAVRVTALDVSYVNEDGDFGELRVHFDTATWPVSELGLIYTDTLWLDELREALDAIGIKGDVDYSEQGMQGTDYVSLDVGEGFLDTYRSVWLDHDRSTGEITDQR